jgi:glycosyltransferase involved in cell wall biosynthesis
MVRFATTEWIRQEVIRNTGATCGLCGPCFDANLFRPRPRLQPAVPGQPVRIAAMVRPESKHRAPRLTMEVLRDIAQHYGDRVEIILFGTTQDDPGFAQLPRDFNWRLAGKLNQPQMARLLNEADVFADFSSYQALGITAQEAMASGAAVIVPQRGGTRAYARDGENCLVINSSSRRACRKAVARLIDDEALRTRLQAQGIDDACAFYPEKPTYNILTALFGTPQARAA